MSISYKEATEILSVLQEIEIQENNPSENTSLEARNNLQTPSVFAEDGLNITAMSLESCDAQELMHCYQLALDFGVPTARRALALYQSKSTFQKDN